MFEKYQDIWNPHFNNPNFEPIDNLLSKYDDLEFLGCGYTCISFINKNNIIYKFCSKYDNKVLKSKRTFLDHCEKLKNAGIDILEPIDIVFENDEFLVYTQYLCNPFQKVNAFLIISILKNLKKMLQNKYRLSDIFYKNWGIHKNKIIVYDYHDYNNFNSENYLYILNLVHMFCLYYHELLYIDINIEIEDIVKDNFCYDFFNNVNNPIISELLKSLYNSDYDKSIMHIDNLVEIFSNDLVFNIDNYQKLSIDKNNILNLHGHTLEKFNLINKILPTMKKDFTLIDCGCSIGGIGNKIAQLYPDASIVLNNITASEILYCEQFMERLCLSNVSIDKQSVTHQKKSYDITLFYALLHHLLREIPLDNLIARIYNMTNSYCVIELPFGNDYLLQKVIGNGRISYETSFKYLENVDSFINKINKYFIIIEHQKINYNDNNLNRHGFLLRKIIK